VGTHEFVDYCRRVNSEPMYCVNFLGDGEKRFANTPQGNRTGDAREAADWVSYTNDPDHAERKRNGASAPFNLKYWQLGNETSYGNAVFKKDYAWSVSLNPAKYKLPDQKNVKVKVFPAKLNSKTGDLEKAPQPLELDYYGVDNGGFGISNCIIFRPAPFSTDPGAAYWCEITGLEDASGQPAKLEYFVGFFKL
jgi:alpha-L-arabinofuranosidase